MIYHFAYQKKVFLNRISFYTILSTYPAATSPISRQTLDIATFENIHFFRSFPQSTVDIIVGRTKPIQTRKAIWILVKVGRILIRKSSVITMKKVAINSASMIFHIPSIDFFISESVIFFSPWWIFIQSFPNSGPCQRAPSANVTTVITKIMTQFRVTSI